MSIADSLFGPNSTDYHEDGSKTEHWDDGRVTTTDNDGSLREEVTRDIYLRGEVTVTRDGDGNVINEQDGWGDTDKTRCDP